MILQDIEIETLKLRGSREKAEERKKKDEIRTRKLEKWRSEGKDKGKGRTRFPTLKVSREIASDKPFNCEKCGLFRQERTDTPRNSAELLPKIIAIDPGQKNVWSAYLYNSDIPMNVHDQK